MKEASELCKTEALKALVQTCKVAFKRTTNESRWDEHGAPLILSHIVGYIFFKQLKLFKFHKFV